MRVLAKAVLRPSATMNKTETAYAFVLEAKKRAGEIVDYYIHRFTFKLAADCRYTPDFVVINKAGEIEVHETKGFMRDDARVKLHTAAALFPYFTFILVQKSGHGWTWSEVPID